MEQQPDILFLLAMVKEDGMYNTDESLKDDYNTNAAYHCWNSYRLNTDIDITKTTLLKVGVAVIILSKRNSPDWVIG
ncbi:hypothetical protein NXW65_24140 [Bacteroides thetaiotaomicron]|uniref:hypothetical protein n=1 Tax=Bacteroides thetaiotaomicron TaxID=818 RepID=UPI0021666A80|nr:hypothetical protein [Bacteroides thetaiotaomicron]MCS3044267.1 hypothetical protein [Bacteroides thetaiotaomicron]